MSWLRYALFGFQSVLQLLATYSPFVGPFANFYYTTWDILFSGVLAFTR